MRFTDEFIKLCGNAQKKETISFLSSENSTLCGLLYYIRHEVKSTPETAAIIDHICALSNENIIAIKALKEALSNE